MSRSCGLRAQSAFHPPHFRAIFRWLTSFRFRTMTQFLSTILEPFLATISKESQLFNQVLGFLHRAMPGNARVILHRQPFQFRRPTIPHEDARSRYGRAPVTSRFQGLRTLRIRGGELRTRRRGNVTKKRTVESIKREMARN